MLIPLRKIAIVLALVITALPGAAANVQGQLLCSNGQSKATGVAVTLLPDGAGATSRTKPFFTGADGMYYLQNVAPGQYQLEIWLSRSSQTPTLHFPVVVREPSLVLETKTLLQCEAK